MDVYFCDQVNDPTLRLFSSTKTLGADFLDDNMSFKFEDDPVMSSAIARATGHSMMDISEMMHDAQSDRASEHNYEDLQPDVQINNNSMNGGGEKHTPISLSMNKNIGENRNGSATGMGRNASNEYDDDEIKPPMAHNPVYMPQHHNIDQVSSLVGGNWGVPLYLLSFLLD